MKLCTIEPLKANSIIKGWRVITPSGAVMMATTRREAETFANFVNEELTFLSNQRDEREKSLAEGSFHLGIESARLDETCGGCGAHVNPDYGRCLICQ